MTPQGDLQGQPATASRTSYSTPSLTHFGRVADLTLSGPFYGNDGNTKCTGNAGGTEDCGLVS